MPSLGGTVSYRTKELLAELSAICSWDDAYRGEECHDFTGTTAWQARQERLPEVLKELKKTRALPPLCAACLQDQSRRRITA
jgi:hypothetical protein